MPFLRITGHQLCLGHRSRTQEGQGKLVPFYRQAVAVRSLSFRHSPPCLSFILQRRRDTQLPCNRAGTAFRGCLAACTLPSPVRQNCSTWSALCAAPQVSSYCTAVAGTLTCYKVSLSKLGRCDLNHDLPHLGQVLTERRTCW